MDVYTIGIPIAFLIVLSLILWITIGAKGHWILKMVAIAASLFFCLALWKSTDNLIGWASDEPMPEKFMVHWVLVKEPCKAKGHQGAVYFWVSEIDQNNKGKQYDNSVLSLTPKKLPGEPRTYRTPYSEEMQKKAQAISQMLRAGKMVAGQRAKNGMEMGDGEGGEGDGKGKGKGGKGKGSWSFSRESPDIMFYELPPARIPDKVLEQ